MTLVNCTPHSVSIQTFSDLLVVTASGMVARCTADTILVGELETVWGRVPLTQTEIGPVFDLPAPVEGTVFIVSRMVKDRAPDRKDLAVVGALTRDASGRVIGCFGLEM